MSDDYAELESIYRALRSRFESALDCVQSAYQAASKDEADVYLRHALGHLCAPSAP